MGCLVGQSVVWMDQGACWEVHGCRGKGQTMNGLGSSLGLWLSFRPQGYSQSFSKEACIIRFVLEKSSLAATQMDDRLERTDWSQKDRPVPERNRELSQGRVAGVRRGHIPGKTVWTLGEYESEA